MGTNHTRTQGIYLGWEPIIRGRKAYIYLGREPIARGYPPRASRLRWPRCARTCPRGTRPSRKSGWGGAGGCPHPSLPPNPLLPPRRRLRPHRIRAQIGKRGPRRVVGRESSRREEGRLPGLDSPGGRIFRARGLSRKGADSPLLAA
eukprot:178128-Prorocentrum_minimum.AAC.2